MLEKKAEAVCGTTDMKKATLDQLETWSIQVRANIYHFDVRTDLAHVWAMPGSHVSQGDIFFCQHIRLVYKWLYYI